MSMLIRLSIAASEDKIVPSYLILVTHTHGIPSFLSLQAMPYTFVAVHSFAGVLLFYFKRIILPNHLHKEVFLILNSLVDSGRVQDAAR